MLTTPSGEISQEEFVDGVLQLVVRDVPAETMRFLTEIASLFFQRL